MRLAAQLVKLNCARLGRRLLLLAVTAAAFGMLAFPLGAGMESLLERDGVEPLVIAVCGEDAQLLTGVASNMADISEYCSFIELEQTEAMAALENGSVTAVLALSDDFVGGILSGKNEPALLYTDPARPLEGMLILYAGQCAADMLSAAQGGIYAVLDELANQGIERENAVMEINLEYIKFTLSRSGMYAEERLSATGALPIAQHYALTLMCWLLLMSAAVYHPVLRPGQGEWRARLVSAGCSGAQWAAGAMLPVLLCCCALSAALGCAFGGGVSFGAMACGVFACGFASLLGSVCRGESAMAALCFALSLALVFVSGGIIPPALMPKAFAALVSDSPLALMRLALLGQGGAELAVLGAALCAAAAVLCARGFVREARG